MIKTGDTKIIQILDIEVIVCLRNSYFSPILNKRNKILAKICKLCLFYIIMYLHEKILLLSNKRKWVPNVIVNRASPWYHILDTHQISKFQEKRIENINSTKNFNSIFHCIRGEEKSISKLFMP